MRDRDLIRTFESLADDIDARLSAMTPRDKPTPDEWARGFRDAVAFMFCAFVVVYGLMAMGGM